MAGRVWAGRPHTRLEGAATMLSRIKKAVGHAVAHVEDAVGVSDADPAVSAKTLQIDGLNTCSMSTCVWANAVAMSSERCRAVLHTNDYGKTIAQPLSDVA